MTRTNKLVYMAFLLLSLSTLVACSSNNKIKESKETTETIQPEEVRNVSIERYPKASDYTKAFGKLNKLPEYNYFGYDIRSTDLSDSDLSKEYDKLLQSTFDSKTIWPDKLPDDFDPEEIMELYKNPGLNVRSLHEKGITGKGVGIGIIDQTLLVDHIEYKNQLKYYSESKNVKTHSAAMHGPGVASIAVGKNVGVAPEADLYYIAADYMSVNEDFTTIADSINELLDLNKTLPSENRIRVISISWGNEDNGAKGGEALGEAYKRAESEGVLVITTSLSNRMPLEFFGLDKIPLSDPDDINSYISEPYYFDKLKFNICVPMNYRCTASPTGKEDYVVYRNGGASWTVPYIAGLYALACQVKPDITYQEFWMLASVTSKGSNGTYQSQSYLVPYIVDPVNLMETLMRK